MKILMPMAGEGKRFRLEGFFSGGGVKSKPSIPTYHRKTGRLLPMAVCAAYDLPGMEEGGSNFIFVGRDFHREDGTLETVKQYFPNAKFLTSKGLTQGQACTCLLAGDEIDTKESLLIAGCDSGMEIDTNRFFREQEQADVLVFTFRHNRVVLTNPDDYGWMVTDGASTKVIGTSIKRAISSHPLEDHAVAAAFWFRESRMFTQAAKWMIRENDRINGEFYVDQCILYALKLGYLVRVFELDRYLGWGTPREYEEDQKTYAYWRGFYERECQGKERKDDGAGRAFS